MSCIDSAGFDIGLVNNEWTFRDGVQLPEWMANYIQSFEYPRGKARAWLEVSGSDEKYGEICDLFSKHNPCLEDEVPYPKAEDIYKKLYT